MLNQEHQYSVTKGNNGICACMTTYLKEVNKER